MKRLIFIFVSLFLACVVSGQEMMKPKQIIPNTVYSKPPPWKQNSRFALSGYGKVYNHTYKVWDVSKRVKGSRQKVSVELLDDGTFMVYFPLEEGAKTAYVHIDANFNGLGLLMHEVFYGDPNKFIKPEALEGNE